MQKRVLRRGITTGTCAAAAAAAAAHRLVFGTEVTHIPLRLPCGEDVNVPICACGMENDRAFAAVIKDAGDDPDITNGARIVAHVRLCGTEGIAIDGGVGVGRVTKPGLNQPVGSAAINSVPRRMIAEAVSAVLHAAGETRGAEVLVSIPEGEKLAKKTFNPRLGIVGGLSVLGTSGIVQPMSEDALVESIKVEVNMRAALGKKCILLTPGNYGRDFLRSRAEIEDSAVICCSNFIGAILDDACEKGFEEILLVAHLGKIIKLAGNIFNTHSKYGDARLDILTAHAACVGLSPAEARAMLGCATVDAGLDLLGSAERQTAVLESVMRAVQKNVALRVPVKTEIATFTNVRGPLYQSEDFDGALTRFLAEEKKLPN